MSELKATTVYDAYWKANSTGEGTGILVYLKSEADKVIADLEESHKMEVEQLLMEIVELKNEIEEQKRLRNMALASVPNVLKVMKIIQHHKYRRCLAMARRCHNESLWWYSKGYGFEKYDKFWEKWEKRWLALADKFKEANNA